MSECQKCGECCKQITFNCPLPEELAEFMSAHHGRRIEEVAVRHNHRCVHLGDDNLCKVYENRPAYCRKFHCENSKRLIVVAG